VTGRLSKGLRAATFLSIAIVVLAGGCDHPRSTPEDATAASYEVLHTLIGKQVTIRGKFSLLGKFGPYVLLGNQQVVYLVPRGSFTWGEPYSQMEGKLVAATGTSAFITHLTPNQQTQPLPELLIIFTLRRRPLNCGLLAVDANPHIL
jgi:hypothetical protein